MPTTLATKQAAIKLQVSPNTLRNWSDQYGDYLGESARPGYQPERQFTDKDLTVLNYIKQLRAEGMKEDSIKVRLAETKFTAIEILQTDINRLQQDTTSTAIQTAPDSMPSAIVPQDYLATIERRFEALEQAKVNDRRLVRDGVFMFMAGSVTVLLFVLIVVVLLSLYVK